MTDNLNLITCQCGSKATYKFSLRNYKFFDCTICSLRFVSPRYLASEVYDREYFQGASHGFGFSNYEEDKIASQGYLKMYLKWIKSNLESSQINLLDVGAANGYFVELARKNGFNASGIEISAPAVQWAKKLDRPVILGTLEELDDARIYDVITVLDVLEHIPEPLNFLKIANQKLDSNGLILINVPYLGSYFSKISRKYWHAYLPPEHWIYFNKKSLHNLLALAGFEVAHTRVISKSFSIGYIYMTISNSPQVPKVLRNLLKIVNKLFHLDKVKFKIYLPLFDNLTVIARPNLGFITRI